MYFFWVYLLRYATFINQEINLTLNWTVLQYCFILADSSDISTKIVKLYIPFIQSCQYQNKNSSFYEATQSIGFVRNFLVINIFISSFFSTKLSGVGYNFGINMTAGLRWIVDNYLVNLSNWKLSCVNCE